MPRLASTASSSSCPQSYTPPTKPQNNPKTRNTETLTTPTKLDTTGTQPCTIRETNPTPTEYRNTLTHNNIQKHPKTSPPTPRCHSPTPPNPNTPPAPAGTQKRRRPTHPQQPPQGHVITAGQKAREGGIAGVEEIDSVLRGPTRCTAGNVVGERDLRQRASNSPVGREVALLAYQVLTHGGQQQDRTGTSSGR
ncbi:hypothetical protein RERY_55610 [Rhodococcus erythropolis]|nr:hypothetical protein RERY_55610 [Rhodococcus erythropolis]